MNYILPGNLECALADAIRWACEHGQEKSVYVAGLRENLKRFQEGEHLEINYDSAPRAERTE